MENARMEKTGLLKVGDLVILPDARRAIIVAISLDAAIPRYTVELDDGSHEEVGADVTIRARTYAQWIAPESSWDGIERRAGQPGFSGKNQPPAAPTEYRGTDRRRPD